MPVSEWHSEYERLSFDPDTGMQLPCTTSLVTQAADEDPNFALPYFQTVQFGSASSDLPILDSVWSVHLDRQEFIGQEAGGRRPGRDGTQNRKTFSQSMEPTLHMDQNIKASYLAQLWQEIIAR
eukprot:5741996-Amphidinium_carterae.1